MQGPVCPYLPTQRHCPEDPVTLPPADRQMFTQESGVQPWRHRPRNAQQLLPSWEAQGCPPSFSFITQDAG